jgi:hypothetical protein
VIKASKDNSASPEPKKRGRKKSEEKAIKGLGLFDHIKHIRCVQDPNYFTNLTDLDKKTFNHFMILKGLSMNPALVEDMSNLFKYFDKIPSPQFYQLLIGLVPLDNPRKYYPWVKTPKKQFSRKLVELLCAYYEISSNEAEMYANLLFSTENGKKELEDLCVTYGLTEKEKKSAMEGNNEE